MVIDIASLDFKDRPVLVLENLDETPIAILGNAFNIEAHIAYNDMSQITFDLPAYANGQPTQGYDDVIGTRLIRIPGWGVFILVNPETAGDGIKEIKSCKAYSREYELTYKKITLEENTYNLWNTVASDSTILGIILNEYLPYWHIGDVDDKIIGKYRTFSESNVNLYNFLKSTVQQKYGCIVDFDTVNRRINVRSTQSHAVTEPVFISLDNLAKEIEWEEDTENIFTCLDVNGADGVTIRGVNPTGTNKIYNLDYYMSIPSDGSGALAESCWWPKVILSKDGSTVDSATRISTINYISPETKSIRPNQGYSFCILAWDGGGTYIGVWDGHNWSATNGATWFSDELRLGNLSGKYRYKVVLRKSTNEAISVSDCSNLIFMTNKSGHFPQAFIDKWNAWKQKFSEKQGSYQILTIERMLKTSEIVSAQANIDEVYGAELGALQAQQSVYIEALARLSPDSPSYAQAQANLSAVNTQISQKESQIAAEKTRLASLEAEKEALTAELVAINRLLDFSAFFEPSEVLLLKQYFKEDSIQDSSFVYAEAKNYTGTDETRTLTSSSVIRISGSGSTVTTTQSGRKVISCSGGSITVGTLSASLIRGTAEYDPTSHHCVLTAYLSAGALDSDSFPNGCLTAVTDGGSFSDGSVINLGGGSGRMYFTRNTTEYEKYAVEWDLYEYGRQCLEKLAYPSYSFSVDTANFFTIDEFTYFKSKIALGQKIYLAMSEDRVLEPIFIGFEVELEDPSSLKLEFGDKYCLSDSAFELADLLNQSVSMGKTVDTGRFGYNAFIDSGASTAVRDYMDAALDVSRQAILSSGNIAISWDESGMKFRKWNQARTDYLPEQIAIINNNIVFTDDGWQTAKMAIGHFQDDNAGDSWGIVAPNIVGTLLASENLVIESKKQDGGIAVFKVDGDGAVLHNAKFDIVRANYDKTTGQVLSTSTHILLDPDKGFGIGTYPVIDPQTGTWKDGYAKFWVDFQGNVHIKGTLDAADGYFSGTLQAAGGTFTGTLNGVDGTFSGTLSAATGTFAGTVQASRYLDSNGNDMFSNNKFGADWLNLKGLTITNSNNQTTFSIDSNGNVSVNGNIKLGPGTSISWGQVDGRPDMDDYALLSGLSGGTTHIDANCIYSGHIAAERLSLYRMTVYKNQNPNGEITMQINNDGTIVFGSGTTISWGAVTGTEGVTLDSDFSDSTTAAGAVADQASGAYTYASDAYTYASDAYNDASAALSNVNNAAKIAEQIAHGVYSGTVISGETYNTTFIEGRKIFSPLIYANVFTAQPPVEAASTDYSGEFLLKGYYGGTLQDVYRVYFRRNGYDPTTYIDAWGERISMPYILELRDDSSYTYGGVIRAGTSENLDRYATLQGYFKVAGVLNTGGGGNRSAALVVNNGVATPENYFMGRTVPEGTVYFKWA